MTSHPRVTAIGGGHGLAATLEAARRWGADVTAIVTVADDGGSSGRLRRDLGIIAPGDLRRCLEALAPPGPLAHAIAHRFEAGELEGHPPGNVLLAGLLQTQTDPVAAIGVLAEAMAVEGRVFPASVEPLDLVADTDSGEVSGQVAVGAAAGIKELRWTPPHPETPTAAVDAIAGADLVTLGPGSLFTSVLAATVPDVRDAVARTRATVVYVANLSAQRGETAGFSLSDHVDALLRHGIDPDVVLVDETVAVDGLPVGLDIVSAPLRIGSSRRHDIDLLAGALERCAAVTVAPDPDPTAPSQEPDPR